MKAFGLTDIGLKRTTNQDAYYLDNEAQLFIVADGMGGHKSGDLASKLALSSICEYLDRAHESADKDSELTEAEKIEWEEQLCCEALEYANRKIYEKAREAVEYNGMGTTLVLLRILYGHAVIAHVGDSRIYRIQDEVMEQLTKDHSRVQELIDQDKISVEEAERYPLKNVITRALGGAENVKVDTASFPLGKNDVFLLCTDGLSGVLSDQEILELVSANPGDPEEGCRRLVQRTLDQGAPDNVTVIISDTRAYGGGEPTNPPAEPTPRDNDDKGSFRRFLDRWFKGA